MKSNVMDAEQFTTFFVKLRHQFLENWNRHKIIHIIYWIIVIIKYEQRHGGGGSAAI